MTSYPTPEIGEAVEFVKATGSSRGGLLCPRCTGGRSGERSVSVYLSAACIKARCHRASCSWWRSYPRIGMPELPEDVANAPRPYERALAAPVSGSLLATLGIKYRLRGDTISLHIREAFEEEHQPSIYMPVRGPIGEKRGGMLKRFGAEGRKKTLAFCEDRSNPFIAWYAGNIADPCRVVIVEDQLSAMRCAQLGAWSVALLGASMDNAKWQEIRETSERIEADTIYLALDRDAFVQSLRIARRFCPTTRIPVKVLLLDKDFKDCTDAQIAEKLQ